MLTFWIFITHLGDTAVAALAAVFILVMLLAFRRRREAGLFIIAVIVMEVVVQVLKQVTQVPRLPGGLVEASGYAFPSGHAAAAAVIYGLMGLWLARTTGRHAWAYAGITLATLIGYSRIALGVHTPLQVVVGAAIGWAAAWTAMRKWG